MTKTEQTHKFDDEKCVTKKKKKMFFMQRDKYDRRN